MNVLYIEDYAIDAELVRDELIRRAPDIRLDIVSTVSDAISRLNRYELAYGQLSELEPVEDLSYSYVTGDVPRYDLVLTDMHLPDGQGLDILAHVRERNLMLAVVVLTGSGNEDAVYSALHAGADDYITKRGNYLNVLPTTLRSALEHFRLETVRLTRIIRVLYAEPNWADVDLTVRELRQRARHIEIETVQSAGEVLERLSSSSDEQTEFDVLLLDYRLPGMTAIDLVKELHQVKGMNIPVVLVTGHGSEEIARLAHKLGVYEYMIKTPGYLERLPFALENAYYRAASARERIALIKSEREFHSLADNMPDVVARFDKEHRHLFINPAIEKVTGLPPSLFIGLSLADMGAPAGMIDRWTQALDRVFASGKSEVITFSDRSTGADQYFETQLVPEKDGSGKINTVLSIGRNITERWTAEQTIRERKRQLETFIDSFPGAVSHVDASMHYRYINAEYAHINGVTKEEVIGRTIQEVLSPEEFAKAEPAIRRVLAVGETITKEIAHLTASGEQHYSLLSLVPDLADDGTVQGLFQTRIDITQLKQAQLAIQVREKEMRFISDQFPGLLARFDRDLRYIFANAPHEKMFRVPLDQLIGRSFKEMLGAERFAEVEHYFSQALDGQTVTYETHITSKKRGTSYLLVTLVPFFAEDHTVQGIIGTSLDITDRRKAELDLVAREKELLDITNQYPSTIARLDRELRYLFINDIVEVILKRPRKEILGQRIQDLVSPEYFAAFESDMNKALAGERRVISMPLKLPNGEMRYGLMHVIPDLAADGSVQGLYTMGQDVTDIRRSEIALQERERELSLITNQYPGTISRLDRDLRYLYINDVLEEVYGKPRDQILGQRIQDLSTPEVFAKFENDYQKALAGERRMVTTEMTDRFGKLHYAAFHLIPDIAADGTVMGLFLMSQDLTEIRKSEMALRERERELSLITEQYPGTIARLDREQRYLFVNHMVPKIVGRPREEIMGRTLREVLRPELLDKIESDLEKVLAGERRVVPIEMKDELGETLYGLLNLIPDFADDGTVQGFFTIGQDITDIRRSEAAMRQREREMTVITNQFPGRIGSLDRNLRFRFVNATLAQAFNRSPTQMVGMTLEELLNPDDYARVAPDYHKALAGEHLVYEGKATRPAGDEGDFILHMVPDVGEDKSIHGMFLIGLDVTEIKRAESEVKERERHLALVTNNFPGAIRSVDRDLRVTFSTDSTAQSFTFQINQSRALGKSLPELLGPEVFSKIEHHFRHALLGNRVSYEFESTPERGQFYHSIITLVPDIAADNTVQGVFIFAFDNTERRKNELALKASETRMSGLINSAMDGIVAINEKLEIVLFNPAADRIFGYAEKDMVGQSINQLLPKRFRDGHSRLIQAFGESDIPSKRMGSRDVWGVHSDGTEFPLEASVSHMETPAGRIFTVILRDITERLKAEEAVRQREQQLSMVASNFPGLISRLDRDYRFLFANSQHEQAFGLPVEKIIGLHISELIGSEAFGKIQPMFQKVILGERVTYETPEGAGDIRYLVNLVPDVAQDGSIQGIFMSGLDITEKKLQEKNIERLSRMQAMHTEISSAVVRIHERQALLQEVCQIIGNQPSLGMAWVGMLDEAHNELAVTAWWGDFDSRLMEGNRLKLTPGHPDANSVAPRAMMTGKPVVVHGLGKVANRVYSRSEAMRLNYKSVIALPLIIAQKSIGTLVLCSREENYFNEHEVRLLEDLTLDISVGLEYLTTVEHINYLAYNDKLTGLPNRSSLQERLERLSSQKQLFGMLGIVNMDIARFRLINDSFGRQSGDEIIKHITARLRGAGLQHENLARTESNTFVLLLHDLGGEQDLLNKIDEILQTVFEFPFRVGSNEFHLKAKCGALLIETQAKVNTEVILRQAELALARAKKTVENTVLYKPEMDERSADALNLEMRLRRALQLGQFVLFYQPKYDLKRKTIKNLEALIRWQDPEKGLIPPGLFIPVLEKTGMIFEVGRWVMQQAAVDYKIWQDKGFVAPRIAVNVSSLQLGHHNFVPDLKRVLDPVTGGCGIDLEITESVIMDNLDENIAKLNAARALGMDISIDDFGTGYSSLSYLAKLPVTTLKIDRSFVIEMTTGEQGRQLVAAIITLAHSLKLDVVAEGVETEEQSKMLEELGCDQIQGYLISRPIPANELEKLLTRKKPLRSKKKKV